MRREETKKRRSEEDRKRGREVEGFHKRLQQEFFFQLVSILKDIIIWLILVRKPSRWPEGPLATPPAGGWPPEAQGNLKKRILL
jgi:hypothetical protein